MRENIEIYFKYIHSIHPTAHIRYFTNVSHALFLQITAPASVLTTICAAVTPWSVWSYPPPPPPPEQRSPQKMPRQKARPHSPMIAARRLALMPSSRTQIRAAPILSLMRSILINRRTNVTAIFSICILHSITTFTAMRTYSSRMARFVSALAPACATRGRYCPDPPPPLLQGCWLCWLFLNYTRM